MKTDNLICYLEKVKSYLSKTDKKDLSTQHLKISTLILLKTTLWSAETYRNISIILSCLYAPCNTKAVGTHVTDRVIQKDQSQSLVSLSVQ